MGMHREEGGIDDPLRDKSMPAVSVAQAASADAKPAVVSIDAARGIVKPATTKPKDPVPVHRSTSSPQFSPLVQVGRGWAGREG